MKSFVIDLVDEINMDTCGIRIGVMKYSSAPRMEFRLNAYSDTESVIQAIRNIHYARGEANMAAAIRSVREEMFSGNPGDRPDVRDIVYLFTDGSADILSHETMHQAELTINRGIRLIPIGVDVRDR